MAIYDEQDAAFKAVEIATAAIDAGWLKDLTPHGLSDHVNAGKETAEFLGSFIKTLATELQKL
ncbi:hypothetical protein J2794_003586 [Paraburkholderia terricola]|uniref:hypothetical protein n=1 Tax=Paraburkholderia terricola TaxID=169427 RepID=UPI002854AC00|nr:hypothetical protein [Paraburkholderia terricola]MDR6447470.1 hypothetical protein [Paraburkholderia terricola]